MDKFPEAFRRFEQQVNIKNIKEFNQIEMMFGGWAGKKWLPTQKQSLALAREADKRGIRNITIPEWVVKRPRQLTAQGRYGKRQLKRRVRTGGYGRPSRQAHKLTIKAVKVLMIRNYVKKGYSANKIQKELKANGKGMRRKEVLKYVRQIKNKQSKANASKYTRKKYKK